MENGRSPLLTQQTCLLTALVLTPWAPEGIKLAAAALPGGDDVLIFGPRKLREKLNVDFMNELKARALGLQEVKKNDIVAIFREDTGEDIRVRYMSVSL